jgi:hypothetical protein
MPSLRDATQNATATKAIPPMGGAAQGSTRNWAGALNLRAPVSVRNLVNTLNDLPPAATIYDSGAIDGEYLHARAKVFLQSDGLGSFAGHVHESGVAGENYLLILTFLDVTDAAGKTLAFQRTGHVPGQLDIGSSDDDWQINFSALAIADHWDFVRNKGGRVRAMLHSSANPWYVTEEAVFGLVVAAGLAVGGIFFFSGGNVHCDPEIFQDNTGQPGVGGRCRKEF